MPNYSGLGGFVGAFESRADHEAKAAEAAARPKPLTRDERRERRRKERAAKNAARIAEQMKRWNPHAPSPDATGDPYATLFVCRINYETTEQKLRREFEAFGPVKKIRMITDSTTGRPRGYAFIEFESDKDMRAAYKQADGTKIDGRRVTVDYERGRTVRGWIPKRLGGGLGMARLSEEEREELRRKQEEREKEKEREREREREREKEKDRSRDRDRDHERRERSHHRHHHDNDRDRSYHRDRDYDEDRDLAERGHDRDRHERRFSPYR